GESVHDSGLECVAGGLADHARRFYEIDLYQPRRPRKESLHRDLDPWREDTADVVPFGGDDVEVRGRAEVDDDRRAAVAIGGRHRIRDPIRTPLPGIVVPNLDAGSHAGTEHEDLRLGVAL